MLADDTDTPTRDSLDAKTFRARKRKSLLAIVVVAILIGAAAGYVWAEGEDDQILYNVGGLIVAAFGLVWCHNDAGLHGIRIPKWLSITIFLLALIGIPVYLLRSRGVRGWIAIVLAILFFAFAVFCSEFAREVVHYLRTGHWIEVEDLLVGQDSPQIPKSAHAVLATFTRSS